MTMKMYVRPEDRKIVEGSQPSGVSSSRLELGRLVLFCLGTVPVRRGEPETSRATCDEDVVDEGPITVRSGVS